MATCTYIYPQFRGIPEIGATNDDNEFLATFQICIYGGGEHAVCEGVDLQFFARIPSTGNFVAPTIGSIGGEVEVSYNLGQEAACREFLDKWLARFHRTADNSVLGIYYIIREVVCKGRFIECGV